MANIPPQEVQYDDERLVPSVRRQASTHTQSSTYAQCVNATNPDEHLIPRKLYLPIKPNNHSLNFGKMKCEFPIILEILKGHPLRYALTIQPAVPMVYLQQLWNTIRFVPDPAEHYFEAYVDHYEARFTMKRLRNALSLPQKDGFPGKTNYDAFVSEEQLCADIRNLGYSAELPTPTAFEKIHLPTTWYTLFSILNKCLVSKATGIDTCSTAFLKFFHGVAYNMHYDYAEIIWNELIEVVNAKFTKKARKFIPFQRFLQVMIRSIVRSNRDIPRRRDRVSAPLLEMTFLKKHKEVENIDNIMSLPESLIAYADQNTELVLEHMSVTALMNLLEPKDSTQRALCKVSEGPKRIQIPEELEQGATRENIIERGTGGAASDQALQVEGDSNDRSSESTETDSQHDEEVDVREDSTDVNDDDDEEEEGDLSERSSESTETDSQHDEEATDVNDDDDEEGEGDSNERSSESTETDSQHDEEVDVREDSTNINDDDDNDEGADDFFVGSSSRIEYAATRLMSTGDTRRIEGEEVENVERVCEGTSKEYGEHETGQEENVSPIQTYSRRATTSASDLHVLQSGIETDIPNPGMHLHTPPIHFGISQQISVSFFQGDVAQSLFGTQLEDTNIETRRQLHRSLPSFAAQSSLEPETLFRTQSEAETAVLSGLAGTTRVASLNDLRRPIGNPVSAIDMPTLRTGHAVESTVMSTGNLIGPEVTLPYFVSREYLDGALKAFQEKVMKEIAGVKSLLKGKSKATESEPAPPYVQRQRQSEDLSVEELKSILYAKLLSRTTLDSSDADLVSILRNSSEQPSDTVKASEFNSFKTEVIKGFDALNKTISNSNKAFQDSLYSLSEKVQVLETTCRAEATSTKRRHDDQDDLDHHEREKRRRVAESSMLALHEAEAEAEAHVDENVQTGENVQTETTEDVHMVVEDIPDFEALEKETGRVITVYINPEYGPPVEV